MTTHLPTCPITGEPMPHPGQTLSQTALLQLRGKTNNITGLMHALNQRLAGVGRPEKGVHIRSVPKSQAPIDIALLDQISDHQDTVETWAFHVMQHINPAWKMPRGYTWHTIQTIYQTHLLKLDTWQDAPAMCDELEHSLKQLSYAADPPDHAVTLINPDDLAARYLTLDNCRTAIRLHWKRDLNPNTLHSWINRGHLQPDGRGRYYLNDILTLARLNQDTPDGA